MITVYVGDVTEYLAALVMDIDPGSVLLTGDKITDISSGTYYTSIGDLGSLVNFAKVLHQADLIVYAPPVQWSDLRRGKSMMKEWTEDYLITFSRRGKSVVNLPERSVKNKSNMLELADVRRTPDTQLWIAGCSISHGVGVNNDQRYGEILSNQLNLPVSFLTLSGASMIWNADQILRSDIRPNDILVWGLTAIPRFPYFKNNQVNHIGPWSDSDGFKNILIRSEEDTLYRSLTDVHKVINFCKKIKIELVLINLLNNVLVDYLENDVDVFSLYKLWGSEQHDRFLDLGIDGIHPGEKTHAFYAAEILKIIKERKQ